MSAELTCLLLSTLLGLVHVGAHGLTMQRQADGTKVHPNRDIAPVLSESGARAVRALRNFLETYPFFVALVVVIELAGHHDRLTIYGAVLYLLARTAYLPLYVTGLAPFRSASWGLSILGLAVMFVGAIV